MYTVIMTYMFYPSARFMQRPRTAEERKEETAAPMAEYDAKKELQPLKIKEHDGGDKL